VSHIKSALEIAMEKSKKIDKLSIQEMAEIKQQEKIDSILARYYKDKIGADELWHHLKGISHKYLVKSQQNFLQSLTFQSNTYDFEKRKNGIMAIENLKNTNQSSDIELYLQQLKKVQEEFQKNKEQLIHNVKEELETDPQKRIQTAQQDNHILIKELSVEEALEQNKQLKQQLQQSEKQFKRRFNMAKEKLAAIIKE
jgi:serine/threonine protein kinase